MKTETARKTDWAFQRQQLQKLAIAAGMTLKDGSLIVVGGKGCPATKRIKEAIGFDRHRMTSSQFSDAQDDHGATRPYFAATHEAGDAVDAILNEWSGFSDVDGEMSLRDYLQISA
jgi:hypothetical protein